MNSKYKGINMSNKEMSEQLSSEDRWEVIKLFYRSNPSFLVDHHINSFNQLIDETTKQILTENENVFDYTPVDNKLYKDRLLFENPRYLEPDLYLQSKNLVRPEDARERNLTYSSTLYADVKQIREIVNLDTGKVEATHIIEEDEKVPIARIPVMVGSKICSSRNSLVFDNNKECKYDLGGYFIVNGNEKVIIPQEKLAENRVIVITRKEQSTLIYSAEIKSVNVKRGGMVQSISAKYKKGTIYLSIPQYFYDDVPAFIVLKALGLEGDRDIANYITYNENDYEMLNLLQFTFEMCCQPDVKKGDCKIKILDKKQAIQCLAYFHLKKTFHSDSDEDIKRNKLIHMRKILDRDLLPHIGGSQIKRSYFLCYMINRLLSCVLKRTPLDDRDSYLNKRLDLAGPLITTIFRGSFNRLVRECKKHFRKKMSNIAANTSDPNLISPVINHIRSNIIEKDLKTALSTGSWGTHIKSKKGVAQILSRFTYIATLSYLRRIKSPTGDSQTANKIVPPRQLHSTQCGYICPVETPEGAPVGLTKHLAVTTGVTLLILSQIPIIVDMVKGDIIDLENAHFHQIGRSVKVFLYGDLLGITQDGSKLVKKLRDARFDGIIDKTVGITYKYFEKEIYINVDGGRLIRPLLVVENNNLNLDRKMVDLIKSDDLYGPKSKGIKSWKELLEKYPRMIEMVDVEESTTRMIAVNPDDLSRESKKQIARPEDIKDPGLIKNRYQKSYVKYTHCEIHPSLTLGIVASMIPFSDHNQSPRNIYQCAHAKQAMGISSTDYLIRMPTLGHVMHYPQKPLITTKYMDLINYKEMPAGQNAIVAIMTYAGYNQEDSVILNGSSLDRGFLRATIHRTYTSTVQKSATTAQMDKFAKPDPNLVSGMRIGDYSKLNDDGYVPPETKVVGDNIIIGKISPKLTYGPADKNYRDSSQAIRHYEKGIVDKVSVKIKNQDNYEMIKSRIRSIRIPRIGDKFCCYDTETEVLTTDGWIKFEGLTMEHKVASLVESNKLKYVKPTEIQQYDYDGKMYSVKSNQVDLLVTPNHRMYVAPRLGPYRIENAEDTYGKRRRYQKNVEGHEIDFSDVPKELKIEDTKVTKFIFPGIKKSKDSKDSKDFEIDIDDWLVLFGIWIAEGCTSSNHKHVAYSAHKQRVKDALKPVLEKNGIKLYTYNDGSYQRDKKDIWCISTKQIVHYIRPLSVGAVNKSLPKWVWYLNQDQAKLLIRSMCLGDGHKMKGTVTWRYDTSSNQLADDFQRLCLHAGWSTNIAIKHKAGRISTYKKRNGEEGIIRATVDAYRMSIITKQNNPLVNKNIRPDGTGRLDEWVDYKGKVYCCTVPDKGIIYIRRNGVTVWCGQSRGGQKGTVGVVYRREDMPFTKEGMTPDIIMNPHAIPSRMTIGQVLESVLGKVGAIRGHEIDGTTFEKVDYQNIGKILKEHGFDEMGEEEMYCGLTGKKMQAKIFIGPTYYQRLKHMVEDKIHSRATGPLQILTRQPAEGRSRDGGLRFGEMERDCMIGHGASQFLKERLVESSDKYHLHICDECGLFASKIKDQDAYKCDACDNVLDISMVIVPYAFKLMLQELMSMKIAPRIRVKSSMYS